MHARSCKATKEQLIEAANRLLNCFKALKQKNLALDKKNKKKSIHEKAHTHLQISAAGYRYAK